MRILGPLRGGIRSPRAAAGIRPFRLAVLAAVLAALASGATAQDYPTRPIRMVIPFAAGGTGDVVARPLTEKLSQLLGQPVVGEFSGGAGGTVAASKVAASPPDGYTLFLVSSGALATGPLITKVSYDPVKSFTPVGQVASSQCVVVVTPDSPITSLQDMLARSRANPGAPLSYGSAGAGSLCHLGGELLKSRTGASIVHVPYRGSSPMYVDLFGGRIDLALPGLGTTTAYIQAGRLRALAVTGAVRSQALPQVPTIAEQGVTGVEAAIYWGVVGPAGMPPEVVRKLNAALRTIAQMPEVARYWTDKGQDPVTGTPEQFGDLIKSELAKWKTIVKTAGITE